MATDFSVCLVGVKSLSSGSFLFGRLPLFYSLGLGKQALFVCAHWHAGAAGFTSTRYGIHEAER